MPDSVGTRSQATFHKGRIDQGSETMGHSRDVGMTKRVVASITFAAGAAQLQAANGTFAAFAVQDQILVEGTNLNNGFKTIIGVDGTNSSYLTVDPPPKDEAAISSTVRTA
jgi:hypothetical protein